MIRSLGAVLRSHIAKGTRPGGVKRDWTIVKFAKACRVSESAVRSWTKDQGSPPSPANFAVIELVLLGESSEDEAPEYREWRRELVDAYARAKAQAPAPPEATGLVIAHRRYLSARWRVERSTPPDLERIESAIKAIYVATDAEVKILSVSDSWPRYHLIRERADLGNIEWGQFRYVAHPTGNPDADEASLVRNGYKSSIFKFNPNRNEIVGLAVGSTDDYRSFDLYPIKFHTKLALIEEELPHACISGGCLTVDAEGTHLITHRRATGIDRVVEAPGKKHSFCGSMIVKSSELSPFEVDGSLRRTAERETREESGGDPDTTSGKIACIWWCETKNHPTKQLVHEGLDVVCLGAKFSRNSELLTRERYWTYIDSLGPDDIKPEGYVEERLITRDILIEELTKLANSWFPAGLAHILIWVAIGAPGATSLSESDCREILERVFSYHGV